MRSTPLPAWRLPAGLVALLSLAVVATAASAESPLTPDEARAVLTAAERVAAPAGSFRVQSTRTRKDVTTTVTTLTKRAPGQPTQSRTERVSVSAQDPTRKSTHLTLRNSEGLWEIYGRKAVLIPLAPDLRSVLAGIDVGNGPPRATNPAAQRFIEQAQMIAQHTRYAGERLTDAGQPRIRITKTLDPEGQRVIHDLVDDQITGLKKQLPFGKRLLVSAALVASGGIDTRTPAKEVYVVDGESRQILSIETFNADGKSLGRQGRQNAEEKIGDLPPETFQLPPGTEAIRPATLGEAMELAEKLRNEERAERERAKTTE